MGFATFWAYQVVVLPKTLGKPRPPLAAAASVLPSPEMAVTSKGPEGLYPGLGGSVGSS